jgi:hypothetical protein
MISPNQEPGEEPDDIFCARRHGNSVTEKSQCQGGKRNLKQLFTIQNQEAFRKVHFVPTLAPFVVKKVATIRKQI